jgi:hypothetical protein
LLDSENLPPTKRSATVQRVRSYLSGLEAVAMPETRQALATVRKLIENK